MLYEDPQADTNSDKRFHIELHFSPGVKCNLEEAAKDSRLNIFQKQPKDVAFSPTKKKTQAECEQEGRSGRLESSVNQNKEHKIDGTRLVETKAKTTQTDCSQQERKTSITEGTERLSLKSPKLEATSPDGLLVEQMLAGSSEKKREIINIRQKCRRSQSECEYSTKAADNIDVSGNNMKSKAISKSMGK